MKKIIVIGAVAAGTSAAAKARRNDEQAEITIYEKDQFISYSGCGMPYFIGGEIETVDRLTPRDPAFFQKKYNIAVKTGHEVMAIDSKAKTVTVKALQANEVFTVPYDTLIIATGAVPKKPDIQGINQEHVFFLRNIKDGMRIKSFIQTNAPKQAVIAGTGFIGFEVLENLLHLGIAVTIVEIADKNTKIECIQEKWVTLSNQDTIRADFVILSTGVLPNTALAQQAGVEIGALKGIVVNTSMQTNLADIYACGDCIETYCSLTGQAVYRPLGSTANKTGRIAGDVATGGRLQYKGNLGTGIFKFLDWVVASTGLTEQEAIMQGYDIEICHNIKPNKPDYMNGKEMVIKAIADKATGRLLGVQIIGQEGVDKRIDVFATLITYKATVDELFHLDLAYAPPFSTTKDPVHYTGMILDNAIHGGRGLITTEKLETVTEKVQIIDARSASDFEKKGAVKGAVNLPNVREGAKQLDKEVLTITYCNKGVTGNAAQNILLGKGFTRVLNLSGGHKFYKATSKSRQEENK